MTLNTPNLKCSLLREGLATLILLLVPGSAVAQALSPSDVRDPWSQTLWGGATPGQTGATVSRDSTANSSAGGGASSDPATQTSTPAAKQLWTRTFAPARYQSSLDPLAPSFSELLGAASFGARGTITEVNVSLQQVGDESRPVTTYKLIPTAGWHLASLVPIAFTEVGGCLGDSCETIPSNSNFEVGDDVIVLFSDDPVIGLHVLARAVEYEKHVETARASLVADDVWAAVVKH